MLTAVLPCLTCPLLTALTTAAFWSITLQSVSQFLLELVIFWASLYPTSKDMLVMSQFGRRILSEAVFGDQIRHSGMTRLSQIQGSSKCGYSNGGSTGWILYVNPSLHGAVLSYQIGHNKGNSIQHFLTQRKAAKGCVSSTFLFTLYTNECVSSQYDQCSEILWWYCNPHKQLQQEKPQSCSGQINRLVRWPSTAYEFRQNCGNVYRPQINRRSEPNGHTWSWNQTGHLMQILRGPYWKWSAGTHR